MPTTVNVTYTARVNPDGEQTVMSHGQLWRAMIEKVKNPMIFVPIKECKVLEETETSITREVVFQPGVGPPPEKQPVKEVCNLWAPTQVDFHQPDGSLVQNIISRGSTLADTDLYLTYAFHWVRPDVEPGTQAEADAIDEYTKMSRTAVEGSIEGARKLVAAGKL
ncbi:hypothetical protein BDY21DRAFT_278539 [Lineolata rhizophorae]|uniref:DUF1857-domain-containing protein n=1 Tax=Lineolata rhizophorae TaxID=578093 RepID=A0A6A6PC58_9PEZI|nr:hypothetical protein BDY21DRAFT_278539 [Lineolata rhizophorae]